MTTRGMSSALSMLLRAQKDQRSWPLLEPGADP